MSGEEQGTFLSPKSREGLEKTRRRGGRYSMKIVVNLTGVVGSERALLERKHDITWGGGGKPNFSAKRRP